MSRNNNIYIGNRYVPIFANPVEWDNLREYEPLTIVTYYGTSYTSKKTVPVGTALDNTEYWAVTGNYNQQVEAYRQQVAEMSLTKQDKEDNTLLTTVKTIVGAINELFTSKQDKEDNTLATTAKTIVGAINELFTTISNFITGFRTVTGFTCTNSANLVSGLMGGWYNSDIIVVYAETIFNATITDYTDVVMSGYTDRLIPIGSVATNIFNLPTSTLADGFTDKFLLGTYNANCSFVADNSRLNAAFSCYACWDGTKTIFFTHTATTWFDTFKLLEINFTITQFRNH